MPLIDVHAGAGPPPRPPRGAAIAVVDVLRASTTIVAALAAGAEQVLPVATVANARTIARRLNAVLAGERHGLPPAGFDLGNSPVACTHRRLRGRTLVLTTTNGTALFAGAQAAAALVAVGALVNAEAAAATLAAARRPVVLWCAGQEGLLASEDLLGAGAVIHYLRKRRPGWPLTPPAALLDQGIERWPLTPPAALLDQGIERWTLTDAAALCLDLFHEHRDRLALALRRTVHGRRLLALGLGRDVAAAARLNSIPLTPVLRGNALISSRLAPE